MIRKKTDQTLIPTFEKEVQRLRAWAQRVYKQRYGGGDEPITFLLDIPTKTHYCNQYAVVTIFDPVMKDIERYIKNK